MMAQSWSAADFGHHGGDQRDHCGRKQFQLRRLFRVHRLRGPVSLPVRPIAAAGGFEEIWGAPLAIPSIRFVFGKSTFSKDEVSPSESLQPSLLHQR